MPFERGNKDSPDTSLCFLRGIEILGKLESIDRETKIQILANMFTKSMWQNVNWKLCFQESPKSEACVNCDFRLVYGIFYEIYFPFCEQTTEEG